MKLSTEAKVPHGKAGKVWLRALARKIRKWLDTFLEEDAASQVEETRSHSDASTSATHVSDSHPQEKSSLPALPATEEAGSPALTKSIQTGPPADWLERVRKGAPELLLPVEEGGTPWQTALEATAQTESLPKDEAPKISVAPPSQWPLSRRSAARPDTAVSSRPNATSATGRWVERLRLKLMPASAARRSTALKAEPPQNPSAAVSHPLGVPNEPPFRHQPVSPTPEIESVQPVVFKSHDPATPSQNPMQRVQQTLLRPLRAVWGGNSFKKARTALPEPVSSKEVAGGTVPHEIQQGRSIPQWPQWFPSAESATTERRWPSSQDRIQSPRTETRTTSDSTVKRSPSFSPRPTAVAREKGDSMTTVFISGWSEPRPSPWPDLPEDLTTAGEDWRQAFREWTRTQALDREQRGKG